MGLYTGGGYIRGGVIFGGLRYNIHAQVITYYVTYSNSTHLTNHIFITYNLL